MLRNFLLRIPILVLPLSLQTVNLGVMWWLVAGVDELITPALPPRGDALYLLDVAAVACIALLALIIAKTFAMGMPAFWEDYSGSNPPYAAGCMAMMAVANWAHLRGAFPLQPPQAVLW
jgi:hypothetical protein